MSSEIFTLIQPQLNNNQAQLNNNHVQDSQSQPGLFESLINGLTIKNELNIDSEFMNVEQVIQQKISFKSNDSFPQAVINILADMKNEAESPEKNFLTKPAEFIAQILNDENIKSQINSLPEEKKQEILQVINKFVEISQTLQNIDVQAQKLFNILNENINLPEKFQEIKPVFNPEINENQGNDEIKDSESDSESENESDSDETAEVQANINNFAMISPSMNVPQNPEINSANNEPANNIIHTAPHKDSQIQQKQDSQIQQKQDSPAKTDSNNNNEIRPAKNFENLTREINNENESEINSESESNNNNQDSGQQNFNENNNNFSQGRENFTSSRNTRAINDSRKISQNQNQPERSNNNNRVESHSNFQAFFEGVLTSRRTLSQNSPSPLNLRANLDFTPSANLRDGVVNVIRFIRADGVQKANIVIDPPALGRISVELSSNSSGVEASIKVASEQIRQLVQDQLNQLRMNLSQQGVQVTNFTVDVQQDNQQGQGQNQNNNPYYNAFNEAEDDSDLETEEFRIDLEDGLLYWVA